jgi:hypothetical protein
MLAGIRRADLADITGARIPRVGGFARFRRDGFGLDRVDEKRATLTLGRVLSSSVLDVGARGPVQSCRSLTSQMSLSSDCMAKYTRRSSRLTRISVVVRLPNPDTVICRTAPVTGSTSRGV